MCAAPLLIYSPILSQSHLIKPSKMGRDSALLSGYVDKNYSKELGFGEGKRLCIETAENREDRGPELLLLGDTVRRAVMAGGSGTVHCLPMALLRWSQLKLSLCKLGATSGYLSSYGYR